MKTSTKHKIVDVIAIITTICGIMVVAAFFYGVFFNETFQHNFMYMIQSNS